MFKLVLISAFSLVLIIVVNLPMSQQYLVQQGIIKAKPKQVSCLLSQNTCYFDVFDRNYTITLSNFPIEFETPYELSIEGDLSGVTLSADLLGLNMNMGQMPLRFIAREDASIGLELSHRHHFELIVAACVQNPMQWGINLQFSRGDVTEHRLLLFVTMR